MAVWGPNRGEKTVLTNVPLKKKKLQYVKLPHFLPVHNITVNFRILKQMITQARLRSLKKI